MSKKKPVALTLQTAAFLKVIEAWDALDGGKDYSVKDVGLWLQNTMRPAIDEARKSLGMAVPSKKKRRFMSYDD